MMTFKQTLEQKLAIVLGCFGGRKKQQNKIEIF